MVRVSITPIECWSEENWVLINFHILRFTPLVGRKKIWLNVRRRSSRSKAMERVMWNKYMQSRITFTLDNNLPGFWTCPKNLVIYWTASDDDFLKLPKRSVTYWAAVDDNSEQKFQSHQYKLVGGGGKGLLNKTSQQGSLTKPIHSALKVFAIFMFCYRPIHIYPTCTMGSFAAKL